ncbi:protein of unknown function (plasmid) [Pararobbsia alpina]
MADAIDRVFCEADGRAHALSRRQSGRDDANYGLRIDDLAFTRLEPRPGSAPELVQPVNKCTQINNFFSEIDVRFTVLSIGQ